jgi:alpha-galactosidase
MTNINPQTLAARAALKADTENIVHAVAMDPLTSAVCTLKQIREMCTEMLEAERQWLPQFDGKKIAPKPTISIPKGCKPVEVPLDPALAIGKRFGTLIEQKTD